MTDVLIVKESGDSMKEFKSTDSTLNDIYENLYELTGNTKQEQVFAIGVLNGAIMYSYVEDKIGYKEFSDLLSTLQEEIRCI